MEEETTTSTSTLEEWANSLVGRDWEIFWVNDGCCEKKEKLDQNSSIQDNVLLNDSAQKEQEQQLQQEPEQVQQQQQEQQEQQSEDQESDNEDNVEDWYDGHIMDQISSHDGKCSFRVRFVGDDTVYSMVLDPTLVRASAKAWIKRSKALLGTQSLSPKAASKSLRDWENALPPDTRTLEDQSRLDQLLPTLDDTTATTAPLVLQQSTHDSPGEAQDMPQANEVDEIRRLSFLLRSQQYLRSQLAPVEDSDEGPSEAYVDHLLLCLGYLDQACQWYIGGWNLHQTLFPSSSTDLELQPPTRLPEDFAITQGLQEGRRVITQLLRVDTSLAGSKRRRPAENSPAGTRKTKRRRQNKSLVDFIKESERGSDISRPEDDEFRCSRQVNNFVKQVQSNDTRWYMRRFGKMMNSLSMNIVAPLLAWRNRVETILGDRPEADMDSAGGETSEEDSDEDDDDGDEQPEGLLRFYSFDEILALEDFGSHDAILRHFDLCRWQDRLRVKLTGIGDFETRCGSFLSLVYSKPDADITAKHNDSVYQKLGQLKAEAMSTTSCVFNVSPLGRSASVICRKVLDDAIAIRSWYLDLHRVETTRERLVFIDELTTKVSEVTKLPPSESSSSLDVLYDQAVARLRQISQDHFDHLARFNQYQSLLTSRSGVESRGEADLTTLEGVFTALEELGKVPVLSVAEEMLFVRQDVLRWKSEAEIKLAKSSISFSELVALRRSLDLILAGRSETRVAKLANIEANDKVDAEIRSFAQADIAAFCGGQVSAMDSKYTSSCAWKERANAVVTAIKHHRRQQVASQKTLAMVDLKRVSGLLLECKDFELQFPEEVSFLKDVQATATKWSQALLDFARDESKTFADLRFRLTESRQDRPIGIIVDPTRTIVDISLELLQWHHSTIEAVKDASDNLKDNWINGKAADLRNSASLYLLVAEGFEVLQAHPSAKGCALDLSLALELISQQLDSRRPMRVLSRAKLESHPLCNSIVDRLVGEDNREGSPLLFLLLVFWNATVADFVDKYECRHETGHSPSLEVAKRLILQRPLIANYHNNQQESECWGFFLSRKEERLVELIAGGDSMQQEATQMLGTSKELLRGPLRQKNAIHDHLANVKQLQSRFKTTFSKNGTGLSLDKGLEQQLDYHSRVFGWLSRTFPYQFLHQVCNPVSLEDRIPFDVLVSLHERKPNDVEKMGDCAGVALRIAELFESATEWNERVTKVTKLSFRGGQRRGEIPGAEQDNSQQQKVDMCTVQRLAEDPVLQKVAMPRESAFARILDRAKTFELHLKDFFGSDYNGADRAPYPTNARSLVGRSGEFLLYRLVGGPFYVALKSSIEQISTIAMDVLADTPGKAAFEWIRGAVSWIDSLRKAVTEVTYTAETVIERLVITEVDAKRILASGKSFFLDNFPDDLKTTLSKHRIFVYTNKVEERLKVVFKKGGAHHSVGGTAVRWCPILFDSLKEDLANLDSWKTRVSDVRHIFQRHVNEEKGEFAEPNAHPSWLLELSGEVAMLIEEGIGSLVVAPPKELIDALTGLQARMQEIARQNDQLVTGNQDAKRRFEDHKTLLQDRFELCDALLARSSLEHEAPDHADADGSLPRGVSLTETTFRATCRTGLKDALQRGAELMGIDTDDDTFSPTLFSTQAAEIEQEMHSRFQVGSNASVMSCDYKTKARILRWLFEYAIHPTLCIKVLLGDIEASELISMSDTDLVGNWKPQEQIEGRSDDHQENGGSLSGEEPKAASAASNDGEDELASPKVSAVSGSNESETTCSITLDGEDESNSNPVLDSNEQSVHIESRQLSSLEVPERPDAPPSLAVSLIQSAVARKHSAKTGASKRGKYLIATSGRDTFMISVSKQPTHKFKARFYVENDRQAGLNSILPESCVERGRLSVDEWTKFVKSKLKGGKWAALTLRMTLSSAEDAETHKKFYKSYESMKRLAMFAVSETTKLFLVTPKFQRMATKALDISFAVETSTYAIVLTKEMV